MHKKYSSSSFYEYRTELKDEIGVITGYYVNTEIRHILLTNPIFTAKTILDRSKVMLMNFRNDLNDVFRYENADILCIDTLTCIDIQR